MNIAVVNYEEKYLNGVLACLKRNYPWMCELNDDALYQWIAPALTYHWENDISLKEYPSKYGLVLLVNEEVVGFFGIILSNRYTTDGVPYILQDGTTWCIDEGYRIYLLQVMKQIYSGSRVFYEVTARDSMEELYLNVYRFKSVNQERVRFFPVPYVGESKIEMYCVNCPEELPDKVLREEYQDHIPYGIKCLALKKGTETGYIFYKVLSYHGTWIRILKTVNGKFFARNVHEVVWELQRIECFSSLLEPSDILHSILSKCAKQSWMYLECDRMFFENEPIHYPLYDVKSVPRLMLNKSVVENPCGDLLYTELALLDFGEA